MVYARNISSFDVVEKRLLVVNNVYDTHPHVKDVTFNP